MPSDADAVRIHVLTRHEEMIYFDTCLLPPERITVKSEDHTQRRRGKQVSVLRTSIRSWPSENIATCTTSAA